MGQLRLDPRSLKLGNHDVEALMEHAKGFDAMSTYLIKSADPATGLANEIAKWTSRLIDAITACTMD